MMNWLQLWLVVEQRPQDEAARVSMEHVAEVLNQNFQVSIVEVAKEANHYAIKYTKDGSDHTERYNQQSAEALLSFINENPERYDFK
ncbi:hypothetical protein EIZ39_01855 [Ammoniphilus sp. CFH 90114]|nr:hypothetical protein EIZ39_01855 [Ammoniphilus sp. CFH 90114]